MNPYDLLKIMFLDSKKYKTLTEKEKEYNFFIINRILVLENLKQSHKFNKGCDAVIGVDAWQKILLRKNYKFVPQWIYSKFSSKHNKKEDVLKNISKETIDYFLDYYNYTNRDLEEFLILEPEFILNRLKSIEKELKDKPKNPQKLDEENEI